MTRKLLSNNMWDNNPAIPLAFEGDEVTGLSQVVTIGGGSGVNPLNSYQISDLDEATSTKYYGFLNTDGDWYILKLTSTEARYAAGTSNYATNWTGRAGLTYDYFNAVF